MGRRCPSVSAWIVDVHFVRGIGRDSPATHHLHLSVKVKSSRLACSPRYRCYRANGVGDRVEAERVGGVHHCATLEIRCSSHIDDAIYGACGRIHDPFRRVHFLCPLGACRSSGIKLPYLVGGSYVNVKSTQDVQLVVGYRKATRQDRAGGITRPVIAAKEGRVSVAGS